MSKTLYDYELIERLPGGYDIYEKVITSTEKVYDLRLHGHFVARYDTRDEAFNAIPK